QKIEGRIVDDDGHIRVEGPQHPLGGVLDGLAAEGVEVDPHGRTVRPTRNVQTRSVSPVPLRSRRSRPMSSRPRPPENCRPSPAEYPTSLGVLPTPNGNCPPRTPKRMGVPSEPSSA